MKILNLSTALITIVALLSFTQKDADTKITVTVTGFKNSKGNCIANLYDKSEGFPNSSKLAYKSTAVKIVNNSAQIVFDNLKPGTYAVSVLHDSNSDGVLNKNILGIPKEGYGASNNILPSLSSPKFEDSKFEISSQDKPLSIKVKY